MYTLVAWNDPTGLPLLLSEVLSALYEMLAKAWLCLTAFLASSSMFSKDSGNGAITVRAQYLLGLGIGDVTGYGLHE